MGTDICSQVEVRGADGTWRRFDQPVFPHDDFDTRWYGAPCGSIPFRNRSYGLFGFLADVRNYSESPVIVKPRGLPEDADVEHDSSWTDFYWGASWVTVTELLAFDYEQVFIDRRDDDKPTTVREFLGEDYFDVLNCCEQIASSEDVRLVFWFSW